MKIVLPHRTFFLFCAFSLQISLYASSSIPALSHDLKNLEIQSSQFIIATESCEKAIADHVQIIDESENFILSLIAKKDIDVTSYEIIMLQKILTNRFLHLAKTVKMYLYLPEEQRCSLTVMGNAIAIYDFTRFGQHALKDDKLRRIIFSFIHFPKYKLTRLEELYEHYTSSETLQDFYEEMQEAIDQKKLVLPDVSHSEDMSAVGNFYSINDVSITGANALVAGFARVWGFISDQLKWRDGYLDKNIEALKIMKKNLRPLDLIYEDRKFTLSHFTIPGHWGHVAIWLGTKEELIEMGIWNKDFFAPFKTFVENGKNIIEIRKQGMNAVALNHFLNLDEIAITRMTSALNNAESILRELVEQIGKPYDFTFNAQSINTLTCAELIAFTYGDIHWPETKALYQVSLRPDDLAILTLDTNAPMQFVLYLNGHKDGSFDQENFDQWKQLFPLIK